MLLFRVACAVFRVSSRFGILLCSRSEERFFLILSLFASIFASGNFTPGVVRIMVRISVVYVDSAVRWRRNGVGGLGIVVRLRLFAVVFFGDCFLQLAVLRGPQPPGTVDRHFGCRRTRCSAGSVRFV